MANFGDLMGRLGAVRLVLQEYAGSDRRLVISQLQSCAVAQMLGEVGALTAAQMLEVGEAVLAVGWATAADSDRLTQLLRPVEPVTKKRRHCQDYTAIHLYFSAEQWSILLDHSTPSDVKLTAMLSHAMRLGLRLPTEPTSKWLTSLWCVVSTESLDLVRMDLTTKALKLRQVKQQFDALRRKASDPAAWVDKLPPDAFRFQREHPVLWQAAFPPPLSPSAPQINCDTLAGFDLSYSCRGGLSNTVSFGSPRRSRPGSLGQPAASSGQPAMAIGAASGESMVMSMLQAFTTAMTQSQTSMVELLSSGRAASSTSLQALEDRRYRASAPPIFEDLGSVTPPPRRAQSALQLAVADVEPEVEVGPAAVADDVSSMLDMLGERTAAAKAKAAAGKAKASAAKAKAKAKAAALAAAMSLYYGEADDGDDAGAADVAEAAAAEAAAAEPKAKAKAAAAKPKATAAAAAAKAKAHAVTMAMAALDDGEAAEAAAAEPKAKAAAAKPKNKAAAAKAKAKAKAAAAAKPKAKGAALPIAAAPAPKAKAKALARAGGCSRCRWTWNGCDRCRDPAFRGARYVAV